MFKTLLDNDDIETEDEFYQQIQKKIEFFYNLHSKQNSLANKNMREIYISIKEELKDKILNNDNFDKVIKRIIKKNKKLKKTNI